jgi:hypothetical protein
MKCLIKSSRQQHGAALILLVFILALAMTTYLIKTLNSDSLKVERERRTMENLSTAKEALIAWAVSNSINPGQMPYPDRAGGGGYDGRSDCLPSTIAFNYNFLIGQLPIYGQTAPCINPQTGLGVNSEDAQGNKLWYAVSRNLVHKYDAPASNPIINSNIINNPTYTWLRVLDKNGNPISSRVVAVIIAPGNPIGNQNRTNTATVENFLDTFIGGSNSDYNNLDEDFFIVDGLPEFNDKLVYITIDELMVALEKRVAREAVFSLSEYFNVNGYFPYASRDTANNSCQEVDSFEYGLLPLVGDCLIASLMLPSWFVVNGWDDLLFYAVSSNCTQGSACATGTLRVGAVENVNALVISTGAALTGQDRTILNLTGYMDSPENTDADLVFDAVGTPITSTYNDQMFIVKP